jgi:hypothetical protein
MRFFLKGLDPFKIQTISKIELFPKFIIQNPKGFGSGDTKESCSLLSPKALQNVSLFLDIGKIVFCIFELGALEIIWN